MSQVLSDIPSLVPLFPVDGTSFKPNQRIQIDIPNSINRLIPNQAYLSFDVVLPTIDPTGLTGTSITPWMAFSPAGVHGLFRDVSVYGNSGEEVDRINYYNVLCRGVLPFCHGSDELPYLSTEQGLGNGNLDPIRPAGFFAGDYAGIQLDSKLSNNCHPFDQQYFQATDATNNIVNGTISKSKRYNIPFKFGFMSSEEQYDNLTGLRLDILLDVASNCLEYPITAFCNGGAPLPAGQPNITGWFQGVTGGNNVLTTAGATNRLHAIENYLWLTKTYPVLTAIQVRGTATTDTVFIVSWQFNGTDILLTVSSNFSGAQTEDVNINLIQPTSLAKMDYTINNVVLYVRQLPADEASLRQNAENMKSVETNGYSFRSFYNYPLNIVANQSNPILNYNVIPLKYCQGLCFIPQCDSDLGNAVIPFPARLQTLLHTGASTSIYSNQTTNLIRQYQIKVGNDYIPLQITNIDQVVPQVLNKELESFLNVACGKALSNLAPHSSERVETSITVTVAGGANAYTPNLAPNQSYNYNRVICLALVPNENMSMNLTDKNIQLLLFTPNGSDPSQYTVHLFAAHYRHLMMNPSGGLMVDY